MFGGGSFVVVSEGKSTKNIIYSSIAASGFFLLLQKYLTYANPSTENHKRASQNIGSQHIH
jgi:hypothetical protein